MFLAAFISAFQATCNRAEGVNSRNIFALALGSSICQIA